MRCVFLLAGGIAWNLAAGVEQTVKNDSLVAGGAGVIVAGFAPGEKAASWLTSPCAGNIRAVQIFWRSPLADQPIVVGDAIEIFRAGTFPTPGALADSIFGPVLTDGVINEYRYKDENNTIPLIVPVQQNETFVVSLKFLDPTGSGDASVVRDTDGIQPQRNGLCANLGGLCSWLPSSSLGVTGDWVIRAVIDCPAVPTDADVSIAIGSLPSLYLPNTAFSYTVTVANAGPTNSPNTTVVDIFPSALTGVTWICTATGGASCPGTGSGNITGSISLPSGGQVVYVVAGTVAIGTTGILANTATAVVNSPASDPVSVNNTASLNTGPDRIFEDDFES
jgi:uncharacterized repeat protein (TIGR01451 family)